jgi:glucosyl-3-phosphoglycerate synthase
MWRGLSATTGDVVAFLDTDTEDFTPAFVLGLLGPLLTDPGVALVKGFYERPFLRGHEGEAYESGRVTELVARPLIAIAFPELAGVVQPLAGEWSVRRSLFASLNVPTGYAVELAALLDTVATLGVDAIAQVDLGRRTHRHQALRDLGAMAVQLLAAAGMRGMSPEEVAEEVVDSGEQRPPHRTPLQSVELVQYAAEDGRTRPVHRQVPIGERPPAVSVGVEA